MTHKGPKMKNFLLTAVILLLLLPSSAFAEKPSDMEVQDTTIAVLTLFGFVFMSSMFGTVPTGVDVDMDMQTGVSKVEFMEFGVDDFVQSMTALMGETPQEEQPVFTFTIIDGIIDVNEKGDLKMDISLKGGNIKSLRLETAGESLVSLEANGSSYNHLEGMFQDME